jgi:hypothetical protein
MLQCCPRAEPIARWVTAANWSHCSLASWQVDVTGLACLDSGQSTGGFTDCLLQHGAAAVIGERLQPPAGWCAAVKPAFTVIRPVDGPFTLLCAARHAQLQHVANEGERRCELLCNPDPDPLHAAWVRAAAMGQQGACRRWVPATRT